MIQRTHSSGSMVSLEGASPTKKGEARATARISRSSRTQSAQELKEDLKYDPSAKLTRTTLMVRNIPNKYGQQDMLDMLDKCGCVAMGA
jgi:hypothetical protein